MRPWLQDLGPKLPDPREPLWMDEREKGKEGSYIRPRNRPQYLTDEAELGLSQFKEAPTGAQETKECGRVLIPKVGGQWCVQLDPGAVPACFQCLNMMNRIQTLLSVLI